MHFHELLRHLNDLHLPSDQFALFGSAPLAVRGIRDCQDLDVIVTTALWGELASRYPSNDGNVIRVGKIALYHSWRPWIEDVQILIDTADVIDGIRYVRLEYVLRSKERMNREKDQEDILILHKLLERS